MRFHPQTPALGLTLLLVPLLVLGDGDNCIKLTGDDAYTWKADGDFHGEGQIDDQAHCFGAGSGGISIGAPKAATKGAPGNTRIECHFPAGESDADFYNCNLSLVDGFSAAVTCSVAGGGWPNSKDTSAPIGCGYDLAASCPPDAWDSTNQNCKNPLGAHTSDLGALAPNFQKCKHSDENPNSAEVFFSMEGAYKFSKSDFPLTCKVGKGEEVKEKRAVDAHHAGHQHGHQHQHSRRAEHSRLVKSRGVADVLS